MPLLPAPADPTAFTASALPPELAAVLAPSDHPLLLLPVRLETRFFAAADGSQELRVRVFPDQIRRDVLLHCEPDQRIVLSGLLIDFIEFLGIDIGHFARFVLLGLECCVQDDERQSVGWHPNGIAHETDVFYFRNNLDQGLCSSR